MLFRILRSSFVNQKKAMAVMIVSVAVGTAIAASLISLAFDITSKVSKELRAFGANIIVEPAVKGLAKVAGQKRYLRGSDLVKIKTIFWRHNILGFVPFLYVKEPERGLTLIGTWYKKPVKVPGEKDPFWTGAYEVMPWWKIEGKWPETEQEVLLGKELAERLNLKRGDSLTLFGRRFTVSGILRTGSKEEKAVVTTLELVQKLSGLENSVSTVYVSALTTPMDEFAYKDPEKMSRREYEKWYCTGYVTSIAKQIEEV
ncbi:MAG: ABC transporter permease, partial [Nitrospirae bacterium]